MLAPTLNSSRILRQAPAAEMERRWGLLRDHMREISVQSVLTLCAEDFLGGYYRWLTDRPAAYAYNAVAIFHVDTPMTIIEHGPVGGHRNVADHSEYTGTADVFSTTTWRSINFTHRKEGDLACEVLKQRGYRRIGLIGGGAMPYAFRESLNELGIEIVDVTNFVDRCKAEKSADEIIEIRATAEMQDEIFEALLARIKPGMLDLDIMALVQFEGRRRGSEQGVYLVSSQPQGRPTMLALPHYQGRRIEQGDHVTVLIENNGAAGYYTELGRTIVLGKASPQLLDAMDLAIDAQQNILRRLRPGVACAELAQAHDAFMDAHGLEREARLFGHGQGYDLVERPLIRGDDETFVEAGMNLAIHPAFTLAGAFGYVCDNYLVQPEGPPESLHTTPQRIFEI